MSQTAVKIYPTNRVGTLNMSDCSENLRYKLSWNIKYEWLLWKFTLQGIEFIHQILVIAVKIYPTGVELEH